MSENAVNILVIGSVALSALWICASTVVISHVLRISIVLRGALSLVLIWLFLYGLSSGAGLRFLPDTEMVQIVSLLLILIILPLCLTAAALKGRVLMRQQQNV